MPISSQSYGSRESTDTRPHDGDSQGMRVVMDQPIRQVAVVGAHLGSRCASGCVTRITRVVALLEMMEFAKLDENISRLTLFVKTLCGCTDWDRPGYQPENQGWDQKRTDVF